MTEAKCVSSHREWGPAFASEASMNHNFFDDGSPYLSHPLLTDERTALEIDLILDLAGSGPFSVLDIGCGFGRHCVELARRGHSSTGVDPSSTMIASAKKRADSAGVDVEFVLATGEIFMRPASFDLAICLFTSLGQGSAGEREDSPTRLIESLKESLRPGSTLIIEIPEKERALDTLVVEEQLGPTRVTRWFDEATSHLHERFENPTHRFDLAYQLFGRDELVALVEGAGFVVRELRPYALVAPPHTFMTLVAECPTG
ncbi:MAG: SAM-dependent methyltransferase [Verrucomicrobiales bacterium]